MAASSINESLRLSRQRVHESEQEALLKLRKTIILIRTNKDN